MGDTPTTPVPRKRSQRMLVAGGILVAGGALAWAGTLLPPGAEGSDSLIAIVGGVIFVVGLAVMATRRRLPEWGLGVLVALGSLTITFVTYEGGGAGTGTEDNEMLYLWVALYAFYFFSLPHALVQIGVLGVAYGWLLSTEAVSFGDGATRWIVTMTTLLVGGLIVSRLRGAVRRLVRELTDRANADPLTGLLNRKGLEERAELELARSRRERRPIAVAVADVDHFKLINDNRGHPVGDEVLRRVARAFDGQTRAVDALARVGGDEFVILLPGADERSALAVGERLRASVATPADERGPAVSISVGIAVGRGQSLEELWQAADRAMYEAKRSGGDGVRAAPFEAATPSSSPEPTGDPAYD